MNSRSFSHQSCRYFCRSARNVAFRVRFLCCVKVGSKSTIGPPHNEQRKVQWKYSAGRGVPTDIVRLNNHVYAVKFKSPVSIRSQVPTSDVANIPTRNNKPTAKTCALRASPWPKPQRGLGIHLPKSVVLTAGCIHEQRPRLRAFRRWSYQEERSQTKSSRP